MGQKANTTTLKASFLNLNLQINNSKFFLYGYFFIVALKNLLLRKNIILSNHTLNFIGNTLFINLKIFIKTAKIFFYKKLLFKRLNKINLHTTFSKKIFKNLKFLQTNLFIFSITVLNKELKLKKNKVLLKFYFLKCKPFLNILFQRRFTFFFDFIKQIILLLQGLINSITFIQILSQLFKYLHKRTHSRFYVFFNLISNLIVNIHRYKAIKFKSKIKGLKLLIKGKLQGKMRANQKYLQDGKMPTQTFSKKVTVVRQNICTLYGVYGLTL